MRLLLYIVELPITSRDIYFDWSGYSHLHREYGSRGLLLVHCVTSLPV